MSDINRSDWYERLRFRGRPQADPEAVVVAGSARFTVLTSRLLRLEWSGGGACDDRSTFAFPSRRTAPPPFRVERSGRQTLVDTGALRLHYQEDGRPFGPDNLSIAFDLLPFPGGSPGEGQRGSWQPGQADPLNLRGTRRTLDRCAGDAALEPGLLSRSGWSLFDDSRSVRFDPDDGWVQPPPDHEIQDWYFFGYGHDYKATLADYCRFGGAVPLIPRFVLGSWWSRYWDYSDRDLMDLVAQFEEHGLPLDVLVVDMDWHTPRAWTGYTWNRELFPDPPAFLRWAHDKGLRVTLNLHPAQGVHSFEEVYPRFAAAMGVDPATGQAVPFRIADKRFVKHYFELIHHPMEDEGVDFWWVDWQQGERSELPGLDPLPWLNHLHFSDSRRRGRRPMLYSRWGGLGSHRYPIGFSGDSYVTWGSLQFQPYLTATAANVAFGWWSHDIGGHMGGATEPELFARWVQFGALSPVLRLHATKDPRAERRPWAFPEAVFQAAAAAYRLRYRLIPYLYTLARTYTDTGMSPCRPMYYEHPQDLSAYAARFQYALGEQMIVAPIVDPADPATGMASADAWLPPGTWIDAATGERLVGPRWVRLVGDLQRLPLLVREGALLPLAAPVETPAPPALASGTSDAQPTDRLVVAVYPGARGEFRLYEDDGTTEAYLDGECEWTPFSQRMDRPDVLEVAVGPIEGGCPALPRQRSYELRVEGSRRPDRVELDGVATADWEYDPAGRTTVVRVPRRDKAQPVVLTLFAREGISALDEAHDWECTLSDVERLLGRPLRRPLSRDEALEIVLRTAGPGRADALARLGGPLVRFVEFSTPEEAARCLGQIIVGAPHAADGPFDVEVTFSLVRAGVVHDYVTRIESTTEPQILDTPFACTTGAGLQAQPTRWTAQVKVTWRGATLEQGHTSRVLFPGVSAWQVALDAGKGQPSIQDVAGLANLSQPHLVILPSPQGEEAGQAAALSATVTSPRDQTVEMAYRCSGTTEVTLNGAPLEAEYLAPDLPVGPFYRPAFRTGPLRLRRGENHLVVRTRRPQEPGWPWYVSATFLDPDGEPLADLLYTVPGT